MVEFVHSSVKESDVMYTTTLPYIVKWETTNIASHTFTSPHQSIITRGVLII